MRQFIVICCAALAGCATSGRDGGGIAIETASGGNPVTGASCLVNHGGGSNTVVTPAVVGREGISGDLRVVCSKPGYRTSEFVFRAAPSGGSSLGLGIGGGGGRVGVGLGMSVPIGGYSYTYPPRIVIDMHPA